jgi:protease II
MTKKELEEQLMKMPELETQEEKTFEEAVEHFATTSDCCAAKYIGETKICSKCNEEDDYEKWKERQEEPELIHKRMNDINTFQAHENEVYLRGTDEYGKDFQICFDSYNFLEWIDTEHLKYIKKQLIKYIKTK